MPDVMLTVAAVMAGMVMLVGISAVLLLQEARRRELEARVMHATSGHSISPNGFSLSGVTALLRRVGDTVRRRGLYSAEEIENLEQLVEASGGNPRRRLPVLLGTKIALMLCLPLLAAILGSLFVHSQPLRLMLVGAALLAGMRGPNWILALVRRSYAAALDRGTPDALDLLVVCSEAGMGLESALERVSQEMRRSNPQVAVLLGSLLNDLRVLPDRRTAFQNFGRRSGVEGLRRLSTMLSQAMQFGTPLGQALRAVAAELRRARAARLEERAVKLAVKLTIPMLIFMMPPVWIILMGGTGLRLLGTISQMTSHFGN